MSENPLREPNAPLKTSGDTFEDHKVVSQDTKEALPLLGFPAAGTERRPQEPLVPREGAFNLPALSIHPLEKPDLHLAAIASLGPFASPPAVDRDHRRADPKFVTAETMVVLGIVGRVPHDSGEADVLARLSHRGLELRRVLRGTQADEGADQKMTLSMASHGELGPTHARVVTFPATPDEVAADVTTLQTRRVNDGLGRFAD